MTVYIEKPAVNLREELASLRNQGGYQEQQFWFENAVTNGDFTTDTDWTKGTGWTISGGKLVATSATGTASQTVTLVGGVTYRIKGNNTANIQIRFIGGTGQSIGYFSGLNIDKTFTFTSGAGTTLEILANGTTTGTVDNLTISTALSNEWDSSNSEVYKLPKGWKPKDVFEDGLLQREGAAHDYEVVYDGFDYFVKPTVAPSATTQTCVIGVKA